MPVRNYRVVLLNQTDQPLTLTQQHLCHGDWTPGGWTPPATIAPKSQAGWQSESGGPVSGTEGWVKYSITFFDAAHDETTAQVYIHWQVPYIGTPVIPGVDRSSSQVSLGDVLPHCDADDVNGGSAFGSGTAPFELKFASIGKGDDSQPTLGSIMAAYSNPVSTLAAFAFGFENQLYVTLAFVKKGSLRSALPLGYDGSRGVRALTVLARTPSVRKAFGM